LALAILDRTIADVLGRRVTENVTGGGGWRHVPHLSAMTMQSFGFEIGSMTGKRHFDLAAVLE